jgi:hypothetical protein
LVLRFGSQQCILRHLRVHEDRDMDTAVWIIARSRFALIPFVRTNPLWPGYFGLVDRKK